MFKTRKIKIPSVESQSVSAIDGVWSVEWASRYGMFNSEIRKESEFFLSLDEAKAFAASLEQAYKLLRHTSGTAVKLERRNVT